MKKKYTAFLSFSVFFTLLIVPSARAAVTWTCPGYPGSSCEGTVTTSNFSVSALTDAEFKTAIVDLDSSAYTHNKGLVIYNGQAESSGTKKSACTEQADDIDTAFPGLSIAGGYYTVVSYSGPCGGTPATFGGISGAYGRAWYWIVQIVAPSPSISFVLPQNGTSTPDFNEWQADVSNISDGEPYTLEIDYSYGLGSSTGTDSGTLPLFGTTRYAITKSKQLSYFAFSPSGWNATGTLYNSSSVAIASTSISFDVLGQISGTVTTSTPTGTSTPSITCDPNSGFFTSSLCNFAVWAFVPQGEQLNELNQQYDDIKNGILQKPPFGYVALISSVIGGISNGTSGISIMTPSSSAVFASTASPLGLLRAGLSWILWFLFAWFVFHRFRLFLI